MTKRPSGQPTPGEEPNCVVHPYLFMMKKKTLTHDAAEHFCANIHQVDASPLVRVEEVATLWNRNHLPFVPFNKVEPVLPKFYNEVEKVNQVL